MKLKEYLKLHRITQQEMADALGVGRSAVAKWLGEERYPRPEMALAIKEWSKGKVKLEDLYA